MLHYKQSKKARKENFTKKPSMSGARYTRDERINRQPQEVLPLHCKSALQNASSGNQHGVRGHACTNCSKCRTIMHYENAILVILVITSFIDDVSINKPISRKAIVGYFYLPLHIRLESRANCHFTLRGCGIHLTQPQRSVQRS